jgi:hypothetical protein
VEANLRRALDLVRDCQAAYLGAPPKMRQLLSSAFFKKLYIEDEDTICSELAPPFDVLVGTGSDAAVTKRTNKAAEPDWEAWEASWNDSTPEENPEGADRTGWDSKVPGLKSQLGGRNRTLRKPTDGGGSDAEPPLIDLDRTPGPVSSGRSDDWARWCVASARLLEADGHVADCSPEERVSRPAHHVDCLLTREAGDVGEPDERLDPASGSGRQHQASDAGRGQPVAQGFEGVLEPTDCAPSA